MPTCHACCCGTLSLLGVWALFFVGIAASVFLRSNVSYLSEWKSLDLSDIEMAKTLGVDIYSETEAIDEETKVFFFSVPCVAMQPCWANELDRVVSFSKGKTATWRAARAMGAPPDVFLVSASLSDRESRSGLAKGLPLKADSGVFVAAKDEDFAHALLQELRHNIAAQHGAVLGVKVELPLISITVLEPPLVMDSTMVVDGYIPMAGGLVASVVTPVVIGSLILDISSAWYVPLLAIAGKLFYDFGFSIGHFALELLAHGKASAMTIYRSSLANGVMNAANAEGHKNFTCNVTGSIFFSGFSPGTTEPPVIMYAIVASFFPDAPQQSNLETENAVT